MPERDVDINLSNTNLPAHDPESPLYDAEAKRRRIIQVLERGIMADRLAVELPPGVYGEWVSSDIIEIERKRALGFEIDTKYAAKMAVHSAGDGTARIGDVVFMTCSQDTKNMIDAYNRKRYFDANNPRKQKEAIQFRNQLKDQASKTGVDLPDWDASKMDAVGERDILDQVKHGSLETSPSGDRLDKPVGDTNTIILK